MTLSRAQRTMLALGLIPVIALVIGGAVVTVSTIPGHLDYSFSAAYEPGRLGVSVVTDVAMDVIPSTDDKVHVDANGTYTKSRPTVTVAKTEEVLKVTASCQTKFQCGIGLTLRVPVDAGLKLEATRTSTDVVGLAGTVQINSSNGSVDAVQLNSRDVTVVSDQGSVDLSFSSPPELVTATTSSGSLHVGLPQSATYAIDAVATNGSTQLNLPNDLSSDRRLTLKSDAGSITVDPYS
jgi:hypothetical protein